MKSYDIAVIGGDGTGPEVTREALKVCEAAGKKFGFKLNWHHYDFGGDRFLKTGEVLPDVTKAGKTVQLTLRGKTNVLTYAVYCWWRAFNELAPKYPTVKIEYAHVDATCMWFVKNPEWFDVIVTDNMCGDIITDLAAMIQGGLGVAAGGNINPEGTSMFEPMGGSAPKYTNLNVINPIAAINAGGMMLDFLGESQAGVAIEEAAIK